MWVVVQPDAGLHVSVVHALPSSQFRAGWTQPLTGSQLSFVHLSWSLQSIAVYTQPLATSHESFVQALLSLHTIGVFTQPVAGSQLSFVHLLCRCSRSRCERGRSPVARVGFVHALLSLHTIGVKTRPSPSSGDRSCTCCVVARSHLVVRSGGGSQTSVCALLSLHRALLSCAAP
jgi:hypothetical protein